MDNATPCNRYALLLDISAIRFMIMIFTYAYYEYEY